MKLSTGKSSLLRHYLWGKRDAYDMMKEKDTRFITLEDVKKIQFVQSMDKRSKLFNMWKLGACHAIDEQIGVFYPVPKLFLSGGPI